MSSLRPAVALFLAAGPLIGASWSAFAFAPLLSAQEITDDLILLYEFEEGSGVTVSDSSGFGLPLDLTIQDPANVAWGSGRLTINQNTIITNPDPATKIFDAVTSSEEITVEAWVQPEGNTLFGAARVVNYGPDVETVAEQALDPPLVGNHANFSLGPINAAIQWRFRNTGPGNTTFGAPNVMSDDVIGDPPQLMHLVATRAADGSSSIYVDGELRSPADAMHGGDTSTWNPDFRFSLAHEFEDSTVDNRAFRGDYHLVAIWNRALSETEIAERFASGPVAPGAMPLVEGDVNGDGLVDLDDYGIIRDNFLDVVDGRDEGDLNFDGLVDWTDFRQWKSAAAAAGQSLAVPEPATTGLALIAVMLLLLGRSRRET